MALNTALNYPSSVEKERTLIHRAGNKAKALNHGWENLRAPQTFTLSRRSSLHSLGNNPCPPTCKVPEASLLRGITRLLSRLEVRAMITAPSNLKEKVSRVKNIPRKKKEYWNKKKRKKEKYVVLLWALARWWNNLLQNIKCRIFFSSERFKNNWTKTEYRIWWMSRYSQFWGHFKMRQIHLNAHHPRQSKNEKKTDQV